MIELVKIEQVNVGLASGVAIPVNIKFIRRPISARLSNYVGVKTQMIKGSEGAINKISINKEANKHGVEILFDAIK